MQKRIAPFVAGALLILVGGASVVNAQTGTICKSISGVSQETIVPASQAPGDPFGRVIGLFQGDFAGYPTVALTAALVSPPAFSPPSGASSLMQARDVYLTGPGDTVITLGQVLFNPGPATLPNQSNFVNSVCPFAPCVVENPQTLNIIGGTGKWANATGQLTGLGIGNLNLTVGQGSFVYMVTGQVCVPKS